MYDFLCQQIKSIVENIIGHKNLILKIDIK